MKVNVIFVRIMKTPRSISSACSQRIVTLLGLALAIPSTAIAAPAGPKLGGVLIGDIRLDQVLMSRDLDGDGNADGADEVKAYFDATNASGLPNPTGSVFALHRGTSGYTYAADGGSDAVYRLVDANHDGDANDAGEAKIWFSEAENAAGFTLPTPNGVYEAKDGAVYIVNAGVRSRPQDAVYRTEDLNGDGDANDAGEAKLWLDLSALASQTIGADPGVSSAFDIVFSGRTAYIADTVGRESDVIFRAQDRNRNGVIDAGELNVYIDANNVFGAPVSTGLAAQGRDLYVLESSSRATQSIYRLRDYNRNGVIDESSEAEQVWSEDKVPQGVELGSSFGLTISPAGELYLTSAGREAADNVFRLVDLDGDGRYMSEGETILWRSGNGSAPVEFARSLAVEPEFLSARGYAAVSSVNDHNDLPKDLRDIFGLLQASPPDFSGVAEIYRKGKNSVKSSGSVRKIAGFVDGVDAKKPEKNFSSLLPETADYFQNPGFLATWLEAAIEGKDRFAGKSDAIRVAAIQEGLRVTMAYWVRFELRYSEYKGLAGNFACPKGAPHNWDEGFAFYYGPQGRYSLYEFAEDMAKLQPQAKKVNRRVLLAFRRGLRAIAPIPPKVGEKECAQGAAQAYFPFWQMYKLEDQIQRLFVSALLHQVNAIVSAQSDEERDEAQVRAQAFYMAVAPTLSFDYPWISWRIEELLHQPQLSHHAAYNLQYFVESVAFDPFDPFGSSGFFRF